MANDTLNQLNIIGQLAEYYSSSPLVKALVNLIPGGGSSLDSLITSRASEIARERADEFFKELSTHKKDLTPELIKSEEFIHRFVITAKAAVHTHRRQKIRLFARLFKSALLEALAVGIDEYEEYLRVLDEFSVREFVLLALLENCEKNSPRTEMENELQAVSRIWPEFIKAAKQKLNLDVPEVNAILTRLNRTGCYSTFSGAAWGYEGDKGKLTPIYHRLMALIGNGDFAI